VYSVENLKILQYNKNRYPLLSGYSEDKNRNSTLLSEIVSPMDFRNRNENGQKRKSDSYPKLFFVQVDLSEKIMKNRLIPSVCLSKKPPVAGKLSRWAKSNTYRCQTTVSKFHENPTTTRFRIRAQTQTPILLGQTISCIALFYYN
jgi:hypothetical protein